MERKEGLRTEERKEGLRTEERKRHTLSFVNRTILQLCNRASQSTEYVMPHTVQPENVFTRTRSLRGRNS